MLRSRLTFAALILAALAPLTACGVLTMPAPQEAPVTAPVAPAPIETEAPAPELPTPEAPAVENGFPEVRIVEVFDETTYYNRDEQFGGWASIDGCRTRDVILQRDLVDVVLRADGCTVDSGTLYDPYTDLVVPFVAGPGTSNAVPIDHMIPLKYACLAGACGPDWTREDRVAFANDPDNLFATTLKQNASKSDRGPASYTPEVNSCDYGQRFLEVAEKWNLAVLQADYDAVVAFCS